MKVKFGKFLLVSTLIPASLLAAACNRGSTSDSESNLESAAESTPAEVSMDLEFADELNIDLTAMTRLPSGLYYEDIEEGSGLGARDGHVLNMYYRRRQVILGWEQGVQGMRIGGKRRLVIPPSLGYGQRGFPPAIPPSATLVFDVELLDIRL